MFGSLIVPLLLTAVISSSATSSAVHSKCPLNSICFALDRSGSMGGFESDLQTFTVDAATEINDRTVDTTYSAYGFSTRSVVIQTPTKEFSSAFIPAITAPYRSTGGTSILSGLEACFDAIKDDEGNQVIVLVTDGRDSGDLSTLLKNIRAEGISVVTVGIGNSVNKDQLKAIATREDFFIESSMGDLVSIAADVADSACDVVEVTPPSTPTPEPVSECEMAYKDCDFMFDGQATVPSYSITGTPDRVFTDTIVSRSNPPVGVLNTNGIIAEFVNTDGSYKQITEFGQPSFTPTHFKPFSKTMNPLMTGVGHQTFHGNQEATARNQCVRLFFSSFQTVSTGSNPRVIDNVNAERSDNKCVVFMTL